MGGRGAVGQAGGVKIPSAAHSRASTLLEIRSAALEASLLIRRPPCQRRKQCLQRSGPQRRTPTTKRPLRAKSTLCTRPPRRAGSRSTLPSQQGADDHLTYSQSRFLMQCPASNRDPSKLGGPSGHAYPSQESERQTRGQTGNAKQVHERASNRCSFVIDCNTSR
jgi:hypothetical protein